MAESNPLWPYTERDSTYAAQALERLAAPSEAPLSETDLQAAYEFGWRLFQGPEGDTDPTKTIRSIDLMNISSESESYYLGYFRTALGRQALGNLGVEATDDEANISSQLYEAAANGKAAPTKFRREVANASRAWYVADVAERLTRPAAEDADAVDSGVLHLKNAPEKLLEKLAALQSFRSFYKAVSAELKTEEISPLHEAKVLLLRLHWAKVNDMVAELYPGALSLAEQLQHSPKTELTTKWRDSLTDVLPVVRQVYKSEEPDISLLADKDKSLFATEFARRLDLVRNGAENVGTPDFSPISRTIMDLVVSLENEEDTYMTAVPFVLPAEVVAELDKVSWDADEFIQFLRGTLADWEMLSSIEDDWEAVKDRTGPAADGKWQAIGTPAGESLSVSNTKQVMSVGESHDRTLTQLSPSGPLLSGPHESAHALQAKHEKILAQKLGLAEVRGRRSSLAREFGGIYEESHIQAMLGRKRDASVTYLRALEAKRAGANQMQVARSFLDALPGSEAAERPMKDRELAADRMLRLYRHGGHDSQPLNYLEQELLVRGTRGMPADRVRGMTLAASSFSLIDAAALHRFGLIDVPTAAEHEPAEEMMRKFLRQYFPKVAAGIIG